jgi:hypothetical protein
VSFNKPSFNKLVLSAFALSLSVMFMSHAGADLLLEPYVGYHTGKLTGGSPSVSSTQSGVTYGGRVGYESMLGFMIGGDVMSGSWKVNSGGYFGNTSPTSTPTDLGIFIGYNFPVLVRVYGEYGFSAQNKYTNGSSITEKGSNIKIGVGYKFAPLVSLNL